MSDDTTCKRLVAVAENFVAGTQSRGYRCDMARAAAAAAPKTPAVPVIYQCELCANQIAFAIRHSISTPTMNDARKSGPLMRSRSASASSADATGTLG